MLRRHPRVRYRTVRGRPSPITRGIRPRADGRGPSEGSPDPFGSLPVRWGPSRRTPARSFAPARPPGGACCSIGALALGGLVLALFFLAVLERIVYAGDVMPGVEVEGVDVASKSEDAGVRPVAGRPRPRSRRSRCAPSSATKEVVADPSVLAVKVDAAATLQAARRAGRSAQPGRTDVRHRAPADPPRRGAAARHATAKPVSTASSTGGSARPRPAASKATCSSAGRRSSRSRPSAASASTARDAERRLVEGAPHTGGRPGRLAGRQARTADQPRPRSHARPRRARELLTGTHELSAGTAALVITPEQLATALGTHATGHRLDLTIDADKLRAGVGWRSGRVRGPAGQRDVPDHRVEHGRSRAVGRRAANRSAQGHAPRSWPVTARWPRRSSSRIPRTTPRGRSHSGSRNRCRRSRRATTRVRTAS